MWHVYGKKDSENKQNKLITFVRPKNDLFKETKRYNQELQWVLWFLKADCMNLRDMLQGVYNYICKKQGKRVTY